MFRIFFALAALLGTASLPAQTVPIARALPARAVIYSVSDLSAVTNLEENPEVTRKMTERLVQAVTGHRDGSQAWRSLVKPGDTVGVKIDATGGVYRSTHRGVLAAILAGIQSAGVPRNKIIIWDRTTAALRSAGFGPQWNGVAVRGIDPPKGLDPSAKINAPILGKLIWGDLMFRGSASTLKRVIPADDEGLSSESYLPSILSREVTRVINVATMSDAPGHGMAGTIHNLTVANLDNNRRFSQPQGTYTIPEVYMDERIAPKVALHILDGLAAQFAGGPEFHANYTFNHCTLYASKDPVALDSHAVRLLEGWRKQAKLPPIGRRAAWLEEAEQAGAGISAEDRIDVRAVSAFP